MKEDLVILVDENDTQIGTMGKQEAHVKGVLHRAISVFIFDQEGRLLLQQRALSKYHTPGLWANTCCSHPAPGEETHHAAHRRLAEEMGMEADLQFAFSFKYRAPFENGLTEHEWDHVFIGWSEDKPRPVETEVHDFKWSTRQEIEQGIEETPEMFTAWFKLIYQRVFDLVAERVNANLPPRG